MLNCCVFNSIELMSRGLHFLRNYLQLRDTDNAGILLECFAMLESTFRLKSTVYVPEKSTEVFWLGVERRNGL